MNLQNLKNNYAQEQGYEDWIELAIHHELAVDKLDKHWQVICIRAQKAALEKAAESATMNLDFQLDWHSINKESITNPKNLIR